MAFSNRPGYDAALAGQQYSRLPTIFSPMKYLFLLSALFFLASCQTKQSADDASILMSHSWYPCQVHITTIDSNSVAVSDGTGQTQVQNKVTDWDTTLAPGACAIQSIYRFMQNGVLQITDSCDLVNPVKNTSWTISQTHVLQFPMQEFYAAGPTTYTVGGNGPVTQINNDAFTFNNQQSSEDSYATSYAPNGSITNTHDKYLINVFTTYKRR
jgi:hypothetical protein